MNGYIIALDQGTTSSRSIIFDSKGNIVSLAQYPFTQIYPKPGWVEHDPMVILESQLLAMSEAFEKSGLSPTDIAGIGITNQRETTIVWDKSTPVYFMAGDGDPVGNYGEAVKKVYERFLKTGCKDVKLKLYKDGRHEMLNELNKDEVYADVLEWLNSKI